MEKKIIVAGLGHGGIAAAAQLSKAGFDVTVYEMKSEGTLGYDWTDIFAPDALAYAGIPMPSPDKFEYKENMTFFGPSEHIGYCQHVPQDKLEIKLERRDIYEHLINHAVSCGVKIVYDCKVLSPLVIGSRVIGIKTEKGDFYADLVIDACGMNSPVRSNLPSAFGIEKGPLRHEKITIFRAFYNKASDAEVEAKFKVCLLKDGITGVSWVASEDDYTDLLIGRFADFDIDEVNRFADILRKTNPRLGTEIVRGGQFVEIPTRQPLSQMVCDGYAAIGDSAFMTVPVIGSGIANSLKASRILTETVLADTACLFNIETLWSYQYNYFKMLGSGLAPLAAAKLLLLDLTADEVDYIFDSGMINEDNITIGSDFTGLTKINTNLTDIITKGMRVCKYPPLLRKLPSSGLRISKAIGACAVIPKRYSPDALKNWKKMYEAAFRYNRKG
ncbi:MAG: hypothetical protein K6F64_03995 [Clostridia bacterium]|nr:hypothetical protein [Clostridia bacterium]